MSSARFQRTCRADRARVSRKWSRLSIAAASRLCAAVIAWKSPVNWRLIVFDGSSRLAPPPVAPPLRPKTGPIDGCRSARADVLADPAQPLGQADRGRRLPLAGRRRRDRRDQDQLARRPVARPVERLEPDLRLVAAVGLEVLGRDPQVAGHVGDRSAGLGLGFLGASDMLAVPSRSRWAIRWTAPDRGPRRARRPGRNTGRNRSRSPASIARSRGSAARRSARPAGPAGTASSPEGSGARSRSAERSGGWPGHS